MDEISYVGLIAIAYEMTWRGITCSQYGISILSDPSHVFMITYLCCVIVIMLDLKRMSLFQSEGMRSLLGNLHAMDSLIMTLLGIGIYFERLEIVWIAMILMSKLFLLSFITRMITGRASPTRFAAVLQTSRAYLHHIGSFIFISGSNDMIILTTIWRFISMSGHSLVYFRDKNLQVEDYRKSQSYQQSVRIVSIGRQLALLMVLLSTIYSSSIRRSFAVSSMGHLSYMVVRLGAVYQLGGTFLSEHDKEEWKKHSQRKKIDLLLRVPSYSWLLFEICLLLFACCYCIFLRFTYEPILNPNNSNKCEFI